MLFGQVKSSFCSWTPNILMVRHDQFFVFWRVKHQFLTSCCTALPGLSHCMPLLKIAWPCRWIAPMPCPTWLPHWWRWPLCCAPFPWAVTEWGKFPWEKWWDLHEFFLGFFVGIAKKTYCCLVGNGWEWGNGIIIDSYCGSFPHSLLSTSKKHVETWWKMG